MSSKLHYVYRLYFYDYEFFDFDNTKNEALDVINFLIDHTEIIAGG